MKKFVKSVLGVTLLEVMLVLAIAAMIIVMSVRYYQSANASNQVNTVIGQVTNIVASADSLAQASGRYDSPATTAVTLANLTPLVPAGSLTTPWGTDFAFAAPTATTFAFTMPATPQNVCPLVKAKLLANKHFTIPTACAAAAPTSLVITYTSNP